MEHNSPSTTSYIPVEALASFPEVFERVSLKYIRNFPGTSSNIVLKGSHVIPAAV